MASAKPQRVFITGASSGIGAALARHYARRGATLGLLARRDSALRALAAELGTDSAVYAVDVRDASAMRCAGEDYTGRFGCPDVVVANAGVSYGTLTECAEDYEAFRLIMDVNVSGLVATFQPFVETMRARHAGQLVGIASVAGYRGLPGAEAYCASKAAAIAYLESLRIRLRTSGVHVLTICPGYIDTPMTAGNPYPMPFLLTADDAARRIVRAIDRNVAYTVLPWQMGVVAKLLRILPNAVLDRVLERAPHKPRLGR